MPDGTFPKSEAERFVKLILPLIKSYDDLKQKQQLIDLSGGEFDFFGFVRVRAAMKAACASVGATTKSVENVPLGSAPADESATTAVMMMLYGVSASPYTQTVLTEMPFNRYEKIVRNVNISKEDNCKYSILSNVLQSDIPLIAKVGQIRFEIDFNKVGTIDVKLANNAYEAFSWDPMMVVYPAQKEMVKRHVVSKVVKVTLSAVGSGAFCAKYLDKSKPDWCPKSKAFEIDPKVASLKRVSSAVDYFKEHVCKGAPF